MQIMNYHIRFICMKKKAFFYIIFASCIIIGLVLSYYIGRNGYVSKTQVHYAMNEESLPLFVMENLCLIVVPISTLFAYCLDDIFIKKIKISSIHLFRFEQIILRYSFLVYAIIVIAKIFQLSYFGEWIITVNGNLLFNVPYPLKDAVFLIINTNMIGRHVLWILDGLAFSYLGLRNVYFLHHDGN